MENKFIQNNNDVKNKKWLERVNNIQIIYSQLLEHLNDYDDIPKNIINILEKKYHLNQNQIMILDYAFRNVPFIISLIQENIKKGWFIEQINIVNIAIIIEAYSEFKIDNTPKSILIDQGIITAKRFCDNDDYKFVNAILDKILK